MAAARIDDLDNAFDDHPSLTASIENFEDRSPILNLPSQHSGFRAEKEESELDDRSSTGAPWSPPGFRHHHRTNSGWFRNDLSHKYNLRPPLSPSRSRHTSPEYLDAQAGYDDITMAANIPLPAGIDSPLKERSPEPEPVHDDIMRTFDEPGVPDNPNNCT